MKVHLFDSGYSELFALIKEYLVSKNTDFILNDYVGDTNIAQRYDVIVISEPLSYLKRLFDSTNHNFSKFSDFVNEQIVEVNALYKALSNNIEKNTTLVLSDSELLISMLTLESKYNVSFSRIPYGKLLNSRVSTRAQLSGSEKAKIIEELKDAYETYEKAKRIVLRNWDNVVHETRNKFKTNKDVIIHVGPPKTGTSAIQGWLNEHVEKLSCKKIHYPKHSTDRNGISSGNFSSLISKSSDKLFYFDRDKLFDLIEELEKRRELTLLLSSEHFYYYLPWLFLYCQNAKFIFYVRHPLSVLESGYNQQVKRHRKTEKFTVPDRVKFTHLETLLAVAAKFNVEIVYRFYDFSTPIDNNIFKDFSSCFESFIEAPREFKKVNTKFSPGSLELMRLSNCIASDLVLEELDLILQGISESYADFSLMSKSDFINLNDSLEREKERLISIAPELDEKRFTQLLTSYRNAETLSSDAINEDFAYVIGGLCRDYKLIAYYLYYQSYRHQKIELYESLKKNLVSKVVAFLAFHSLPIMIRIKKVVQRLRSAKLRL
ncbi:sulfotransferase domain-containing protein [Alteromonas sp. 009811495]|uniref:sulfotransferase domain-containing protein n=1 Tax=Alteromonas sp. 009811495 TaxID=3002962 RepID=UPI00237D6615|nr:sulfotransferase domain-containing protein [Alteromonas sp. 009811495]WDT85585.1 hypothetical protein OZ660_16880 [Alteromonas sp. 009811495]